jgi:hypothetical protein
MNKSSSGQKMDFAYSRGGMRSNDDFRESSMSPSKSPFRGGGVGDDFAI